MGTDQKLSFQHITIIGVGLIGGSMALAIKQRFPKVHITGVDKPQVLKSALERKAIDTAERSIERGVHSAELVIIAAPVSAIAAIFPRIAKACLPNAVITDTGSVKHELVEQAERFFPKGNFIGGHPMTGSEFSGIEAANPLLFQNAIYILTPVQTTKKKQLKLLADFLTSLDACIVTIDPVTHDSVVAAVSHLPQLAAVTLMNTVGMYHQNAPAYLALAAGGFRDMTRIGSSPFKMWKDILNSNQKEVSKVLRLYIKQLKRIADMVDSNPDRLASEFQTSRKLRSRLPRSMKGFLSPLIELSVYVSDKPGELARLTSSLASHSINIKDIELLKVREGRGGNFRLSFENRSVAAEAAHVLQETGFDVGETW